jgi:hypothetical protein
MASPQRLVLFVEGEADRLAAPVLVKHLLTEMNAWEHVFLDDAPFQVGNVAEATVDAGRRWIRYLEGARRRPKLGAVLLLQDGDIGRVRGEDFCPCLFGRRLAEWAKQAGGGSVFSVAVVFACMEYESWLIACADRLSSHPHPDGWPGIPPDTVVPDEVEKAPRDAKGWLDRCMREGYKNTRDQELLTRLMIQHLDAIRGRNLRSFRRLERALCELVHGVQSGQHVVSPDPPS